jgi:hypothetical protein
VRDSIDESTLNQIASKRKLENDSKIKARDSGGSHATLSPRDSVLKRGGVAAGVAQPLRNPSPAATPLPPRLLSLRDPSRPATPLPLPPPRPLPTRDSWRHREVAHKETWGFHFNRSRARPGRPGSAEPRRPARSVGDWCTARGEDDVRTTTICIWMGACRRTDSG